MAGKAAVLFLRATCKYIQAKSGDGCYSLAQRCHISQSALTKYNSAHNFCNTIQVNDYVCCSSGTLPDFSPKPSGGNCYAYAVKKGDTCYDIATAHHIKDYAKIETYNKQTWGWAGCSSIKEGQKICLSTGSPPFPASIKNAVCGPQKPGTKKPSKGSSSDWAKLNPCPLNACCDIWGQCGITAEFCTKSPAKTGAPGTAKPKTNGCISNCGHEVVNNGKKVSSHKRIAYFEAWNKYRSCLHMDISDVDQDYYTHIHWAFANLTSSWHPDVSGLKGEFSDFKLIKGAKRIVSFGGWAFSTDAGTYESFRNGVKPEHREAFASNVVKFVHDNGLDGVDFDFEYPGAQDIPGIPPDSLTSGASYALFLELVRKKLDKSKTVSIAAPASFWYLKGFPISKIASTVDYIVYMTYDMHGQWDYSNKWADDGCPAGGCLRSHVNDTEIHDAMAMITKAGVQASQIVIGLPLYGRSFKMVDAKCKSSQCRFTGPKSGARPGRCTKTAGYISNYEIQEIIADAKKHKRPIQQYYDRGDVLIYNSTEYVSYLSPSSYAHRRSWADGFGFGGTVDWAIDLNATYTDDLDEYGEEDDNLYNPDFKTCDYSKKYKNLDDLYKAAGGFNQDCVAIYAVDTLITMLDVAYKNYTNVNNGYDELYGYYVTYMKKLIPEVLVGNFFFNLTNDHEWVVLPNMGFGAENFDCSQEGRNYPCSKFNGSDNTKPQDAYEHPINLKLSRDKKDYYKDLGNVGLDPSWVVFGDYQYDRTVVLPRAARKFEYKFTNFPIENPKTDIPNPKDIVTKGLKDIPGLRRSMLATYWQMRFSQYTNGLLSDAANAYSYPVFMLIQAVEGMAQAKALGTTEKKEEEEERKRKKNFILLIVSLVLLIVPVVGEELAAGLGLANLGRALALAGELGNGGLTIYDTVNDPSSAFVNVLGLLFGVGAIAKVAKDERGLAKIAGKRAGMRANELASLGTLFKENNAKLDNVMKVCKWK